MQAFIATLLVIWYVILKSISTSADRLVMGGILVSHLE